MKKIYILAIAAIFTTVSFAQRAANQEPFSFDMEKDGIHPNNKATTDTIYNHFIGGTPAVFNNTTGGYVIGHNPFGDLSKMQLFDANHGLNSTNGNINGLLFWFAHAEGNPASIYKATIWADNAGAPGNILGTVSVPYSAIDTVAANTMTNGIVAWNSVATFTTPISIPTDQKFWAGIELVYAAGDTLGLVTTSNGDFTDAATHAFEEWSDNTFHDLNSAWGLDAAIAVFPLLDFAVGIEELNNVSFNVYPNPSNGIFTINLDASTSGSKVLTVKNIVGQTIINKTVKVAGQTTETVSLSGYSKGVYFLTVGNKTVKLIVE